MAPPFNVFRFLTRLKLKKPKSPKVPKFLSFIFAPKFIAASSIIRILLLNFSMNLFIFSLLEYK